MFPRTFLGISHIFVISVFFPSNFHFGIPHPPPSQFSRAITHWFRFGLLPPVFSLSFPPNFLFISLQNTALGFSHQILRPVNCWHIWRRRLRVNPPLLPGYREVSRKSPYFCIFPLFYVGYRGLLAHSLCFGVFPPGFIHRFLPFDCAIQFSPTFTIKLGIIYFFGCSNMHEILIDISCSVITIAYHLVCRLVAVCTNFR